MFPNKERNQVSLFNLCKSSTTWNPHIIKKDKKISYIRFNPMISNLFITTKPSYIWYYHFSVKYY